MRHRAAHTPSPDAPSGSDAAGFEQRLREVRVIVGALMAGVALFAGVVVVLDITTAPGIVGTTALIGVLAAALIVQLVVAPLVGTKAREAQGVGFMAYQTGVIVTAALREGVGLLGVMLAFLSGPTIWAGAFAAVTVATLGLGWPRREEAERAWRADRSGEG